MKRLRIALTAVALMLCLGLLLIAWPGLRRDVNDEGAVPAIAARGSIARALKFGIAKLIRNWHAARVVSSSHRGGRPAKARISASWRQAATNSPRLPAWASGRMPSRRTSRALISVATPATASKANIVAALNDIAKALGDVGITGVLHEQTRGQTFEHGTDGV